LKEHVACSVWGGIAPPVWTRYFFGLHLCGCFKKNVDENARGTTGKVVIHAVHERNIEAFWKKLKLQKVEQCLICSCVVKPKSVGAFIPWKGQVRVICKKPICFGRLAEKRRRG